MRENDTRVEEYTDRVSPGDIGYRRDMKNRSKILDHPISNSAHVPPTRVFFIILDKYPQSFEIGQKKRFYSE